MPGKSWTEGSQRETPAGLPWCSLVLDWPCEIVVLLLEVVVPRTLNAFEWILAHALTVVSEGMPTLAELSDELGIQAPVFLQEGLRTLVELGAVEWSDATQPDDLPNGRLTPLGAQLLRTGQTFSLAEHHGMQLCLDLLTGESMAYHSRQIRKTPTHPLIEPAQLPKRTEIMGLDRVRVLSQAQGEPFHESDSQIRSASVQIDKGFHGWKPVRVALSLSPEGTLRAQLPGESETQQAWFTENGWKLRWVEQLTSACTAGWGGRGRRPRLEPVAFEPWLPTVDYLVPPTTVAQEACRWIQSARQELVLHAGWLDAPPIEKALTEAARRGVRCYVCAADPGITSWSAQPEATPGFVASGGQDREAQPLVLIVDGSRAIRIQQVEVKIPAGRELVIELASVLRAAHVAALRDHLLADIQFGPSDESIPHLFARFAITGDSNLWERGVRQIQAQTSHLEQIRELHQWGRWAQHLFPQDEPADGWLKPAIQSWLAVASNSDASDPSVHAAAVGLLAPDQVLSHLVAQVEHQAADGLHGATRELIVLAGGMARRWPGFQPVRDCPRFTQVLSRGWTRSGHDEYAADVTEIVRALSAHPRFDTEASSWLGLISAALPVPRDLAGFAEWLEAHEALKARLDGSFQPIARQYLHRLQDQLRAAQSRGDSIAQSIHTFWQALGLPAAMLPGHVPARGSAAGTEHRHVTERNP